MKQSTTRSKKTNSQDPRASRVAGAGTRGASRRSATAGKRTAAPDRTIRGPGKTAGKGVAQLTSNTRAANEARYALSRDDSDFARFARTKIAGHRSATDRRVKAKRDGSTVHSRDRGKRR
jgi:hypothetical protein